MHAARDCITADAPFLTKRSLFVFQQGMPAVSTGLQDIHENIFVYFH